MRGRPAASVTTRETRFVAEAVIRCEALVKRFGHVVALDGLDLEVPAGEVVGYLGPNGAGKSTTIRILLDLARPSAGRVEVLGADPRRAGATLRARHRPAPGRSSVATSTRRDRRPVVAARVRSPVADGPRQTPCSRSDHGRHDSS
jgi:ABC-type glutathione transport system ATPase component